MIVIELAFGFLSVVVLLAFFYALLVQRKVSTGLFILVMLLFLANMFMAEDDMIGVVRLGGFLIVIVLLGVGITAVLNRGID